MSARTGVRVITLAVLLLVFPTGALAQSVVGVLGIAGEIAPIEKRLQDSRDVAVRGYVFRVGTLNGRQVVVGRSGAGKVNAAIIATLMIGQFAVSCLVIRSITDRADGQAQSSYEQFLATASENAAALVAAIIAGLEDSAR